MVRSSQVNEALKRLEKLCEAQPELRPLGQISSQLLDILFSRSWAEAVVWPCASSAGTCPEITPLLRSHPPTIDPAAMGHLWEEVTRVLGAGRESESAEKLRTAARAGRLDPVKELRSILSGHLESSLGRMTELGCDLPLAFTVLRLCGLPLLSTLASSCEQIVAQSAYQGGDCPVCGNRTMLAELRGLEQFRWLRCGWCAAQWHVDRIYCPFCATRDHRELRELIAEGNELGCRIMTCDSCKQAIPVLPTLVRITPPGLIVAELETLSMQFAAATRGEGPSRPSSFSMHR